MAVFYKIHAPDKAYNGTVGTIAFNRGVARVGQDEISPRERAYLVRRGYTIEAVEETPAKGKDADEPAKDDAESAGEVDKAKAAAKPAASRARS